MEGLCRLRRVGFTVAAIAVTIAIVVGGLAFARSRLSDPRATLTIESVGSLPARVKAVSVGEVPCRPSGRQGYLFTDYALAVPKGFTDEDLIVWIEGQGLTSAIGSGDGIVRSDGARHAQLWTRDEYEATIYGRAFGGRELEGIGLVLRLWPEARCVP